MRLALFGYGKMGKEIENTSENMREEPFYVFLIRDNGIGFDKQFSEQMFLIFQRLNSQEDFEGTGIGLALCKGIVINHHGEIYADARHGEGTQFHIILPVEQGSKLILWKNQ